MKVVLFCGGQGTRLRDYSETIPKPLVKIGYRPILWNIMKYYAHYGYKEFILCLGYKGDKIKDFFVNYDETISNDFVFQKGGEDIQLLNSDIDDWKITFVDSGINANIGMRLMKVREHLKGEKMFLANYADGLSDMHLPSMVDFFHSKPNKVGCFMTYQPTASFHVVRSAGNGDVETIAPISKANLWLNTGFFLFTQQIFDYIKHGEELVVEPFQRLIKENRLITYHHEGFWQAMDTFKDKMLLDELMSKGNPPWEVWNKGDNIKTAQNDPVIV
jgi:glucose-1-phosphate cytidylyltransferase